MSPGMRVMLRFLRTWCSVALEGEGDVMVEDRNMTEILAVNRAALAREVRTTTKIT